MSSSVGLSPFFRVFGWQEWNGIDFTSAKERVVQNCFYVASRLTDPACNFHKIRRLMAVSSVLHPTDSKMAYCVRQVLLGAQALGWVAAALVTSVPGIALRAFAGWLQDQPFIHIVAEEKSSEWSLERQLTVLSWNVCCIGGGYPITNGGVMPWPDRIDAIADKVIEAAADVVSLYEIFDIQSAFSLVDRLKKAGYQDFYFNIGPRAVGVSSGLFVASKYSLGDPEFIAFPEDTLVGRTKKSSKGVFSFNTPRAWLFVTHLQHSEASAFPTPEEKKGRSEQMQIIVERMKKVTDRAVVVTGDLNLGDLEFQESDWKQEFDPGELQFTSPDDYTWGGDQFCAELVGDTAVSGPMNLDWTLAKKGSVASLSTHLVKTGFDATRLDPKALSDHAGLFSRIQFLK